MSLQSTDINAASFNPFSLFAKRWGLLTAGTPEHFNPMTVAWGMFGHMWWKNVITVVVRPQRYTFALMEQERQFTVSFFREGEKREALNLCGSKSGRDINKTEATGLTPRITEHGVFFEEAELVFCARTIYKTRSAPDSFLETSIPKEIYAKKDYHHWYIGEITAFYSN